MTQTHSAPLASIPQPADLPTGMLGLLLVLARHKKLVFGLPLLVALLTLAVSLLLPNQYRASTKLLPPQQAQSSAAAVLAQLGGMAGAAAGVSGLKSPNELYIGMLRSRSVADKLIVRHKLMQVYGTDSLEMARFLLAENTVIDTGRDGMITIEVQGDDQKLVAPLANDYVRELLGLTRVLAVTESSQRRVFFERQLELSKNNLAKAEIALKGALDSRGVISVDAESTALMETVARLRAQASAKEVEVSAMRAFLTPANPEYRRAAEELNSLRQELSNLENGRAGSAAAPGASRNGIENVQLLRDVKYYQMLYELLAKQYEVARLDEAKDPSLIQVLDPAVEPERKFKPRRALLVTALTVLALLASVMLAILIELKRRALATPGAAGQWDELKAHLRRR